jgi:hypothetical protein
MREGAVVRLDRVVATMERRFVEAKKKPRIALDEVIVVEGRAGYRLAVKVRKISSPVRNISLASRSVHNLPAAESSMFRAAPAIGTRIRARRRSCATSDARFALGRRRPTQSSRRFEAR